MKTLLLTLLLVTSAAHADQWLVNGCTYKGTIHKLSADRTKIYVTSDWDNYRGSWIKVADLDSATRVRLDVATLQEHVTVQAEKVRAALEQEHLRLIEAQAQARAASERLIRIEEQKLAIQRETLEIKRREENRRAAEQQRNQQWPNIRLTLPYGQGIPQIPQISPIILWNN